MGWEELTTKCLFRNLCHLPEVCVVKKCCVPETKGSGRAQKRNAGLGYSSIQLWSLRELQRDQPGTRLTLAFPGSADLVYRDPCHSCSFRGHSVLGELKRTSYKLFRSALRERRNYKETSIAMCDDYPGFLYYGITTVNAPRSI